jgi:hypothetical protein
VQNIKHFHFERKFLKICDFKNTLEKLGTQFWCEIKIINCEENFNNIALEHMEDEPETVEPYIMEFHN